MNLDSDADILRFAKFKGHPPGAKGYRPETNYDEQDYPESYYAQLRELAKR
jgi:hypothetical protein